MCRFFLGVCILMCSCLNVYAQGCSDAGFCTSGAIQSIHANKDLAFNNSIAISNSIGSAENGTTIIIPQIEIKKTISKKSYLEVKLPYNITSGNLGDHQGIGDPVINYIHQLSYSYRDWQFIYSIGTRIGLGNANAQNEYGKPLPLTYQNSLGTTDIILGLSTIWKKYITMAIGYQQPLIQYNENEYLGTKVVGSNTNDKDYFSSRKLQRRGDILLRIDGHYIYHNIGLSLGPLFINHLGKDKITLNDGSIVSIDGSEGLTLNIVGNIYYIFRHWKADLLVGTPIIVRPYRPDGLTRAWILSPRLTYSFD